jgi:hypothetical protein
MAAGIFLSWICHRPPSGRTLNLIICVQTLDLIICAQTLVKLETGRCERKDPREVLYSNTDYVLVLCRYRLYDLLESTKERLICVFYKIN